jgi:hypothetical protein
MKAGWLHEEQDEGRPLHEEQDQGRLVT